MHQLDNPLIQLAEYEKILREDDACTPMIQKFQNPLKNTNFQYLQLTVEGRGILVMGLLTEPRLSSMWDVHLH